MTDTRRLANDLTQNEAKDTMYTLDSNQERIPRESSPQHREDDAAPRQPIAPSVKARQKADKSIPAAHATFIEETLHSSYAKSGLSLSAIRPGSSGTMPRKRDVLHGVNMDPVIDHSSNQQSISVDGGRTMSKGDSEHNDVIDLLDRGFECNSTSKENLSCEQFPADKGLPKHSQLLQPLFCEI